MYEKLRVMFRKIPKENAIMMGAIFVTVILSLWVIQKPATPPEVSSGDELGVSIPEGFLIVPLQLANASGLDRLIERNGIIDVFQRGRDVALAQNLRVIKTHSGEGPLFGALVPSKMAGHLQVVFGRPQLMGAIRTLNSGPTEFHLAITHQRLVTEIPISED